MANLVPTPREIKEAQEAVDGSVESLTSWSLVRRHPDVGYTALIGYVEDDKIPEAVSEDECFYTLAGAVRRAKELDKYWSIHPECYRPASKLVKGL